jgi:hypothetical protein
MPEGNYEVDVVLTNNSRRTYTLPGKPTIHESDNYVKITGGDKTILLNAKNTVTIEIAPKTAS